MKIMYEILNILPLDLFLSFPSILHMTEHVQRILPDCFYQDNTFILDDNKNLDAYLTQGNLEFQPFSKL